MFTPITFWLRAEVKEAERRTPLTPSDAKTVLARGHKIFVERSVMRCVPDEEYAAVGCTLVPEGTWLTSPPPLDVVILGLKELPESDAPLQHRHILFAHCFKNQDGWRELLHRFDQGNGMIWDLEFLNDERGRRVAAFGRSAGFNGMALGLKQWALQQLGETLPKLDHYKTSEALVADVRADLERAKQATGKSPKVLVIGALGRCGGGSVQCAQLSGIEDLLQWDLNETKRGGPFEELLDVDVVCNCIYLMGPIAPFITTELLHRPGRRVSVLVDVSCDPNNLNNPVPVYSEATTFFRPVLRVIEQPPFDVIAIDHLPSLVPIESSTEFSGQVVPHLAECGETDVWKRAEALFRSKLVDARQTPTPRL